MKYKILFYRLTDEYERPIMIDVVVEEELTTRRQNASMQVTLHKHKYTMELIKTSEYFKPGLKYTAFVSISVLWQIGRLTLQSVIRAPHITHLLQLKLAYHDGSPVQDTKNPVLIAYGYTYNQAAYSNLTRMLDEHGMIQLDFYPPKSTDNSSFPLNIEVKYANPLSLQFNLCKCIFDRITCVFAGTIFKSSRMVSLN